MWHFFEKSSPDQLIHLKLSANGSSDPRKQTISGLKLHLSKFHETEHEQYLKRQLEIDKLKSEAK
ncbi:hypothetical protein HHI36_007772 [Cryptolaemus montrouzieri]|uniref:Uncharacterized protein n=1 Tax=Cryptolaemus montrouzieri TaxID=559131 RepID=A0ABD2MQZ1_9CUCU